MIRGLVSGLAELARRLDIADGVVFVGPVSGRQKVALYQHGRVFGLPSDDENFGIAVAEAMAAGHPSRGEQAMSPFTGLWRSGGRALWLPSSPPR